MGKNQRATMEYSPGERRPKLWKNCFPSWKKKGEGSRKKTEDIKIEGERHREPKQVRLPREGKLSTAKDQVRRANSVGE